MRVDELRPLPPLRRPERRAARRAGRGAAPRSRFEPGVELFREGDPADFWWVLRRRGDRPGPRTSAARTTVVGRMDVPGRWAGGFRAWDEHGVYLATGRGARRRAGAPGAGRAAAGARRRLVPVRRAPDRGLVPHGALHRVDGPPARVPGHARHAGRRPRPRDQQPGRRRDPRGRRPRRRVRDAAGVAGAAGRAGRSRPSSSSALDELRREIEPPAGDPDPLADRRPRGGAVQPGWTEHGVEQDWRHRPGAGGRRGRRRLVRAGRGGAGRSSARAGLWSGWPARCPSRPCSPRSRSRPGAISELVAAVQSYSQLDRASLQQIDVTDGLESTLVMLGHKLRRRHHGGARLRRRRAADRGLSRASSTRSGPT